MSSWEFDEEWLYWIAGAGGLLFAWGAYLFRRARPRPTSSQESITATDDAGTEVPHPLVPAPPDAVPEATDDEPVTPTAHVDLPFDDIDDTDELLRDGEGQQVHNRQEVLGSPEPAPAPPPPPPPPPPAGD